MHGDHDVMNNLTINKSKQDTSDSPKDFRHNPKYTNFRVILIDLPPAEVNLHYLLDLKTKGILL